MEYVENTEDPVIQIVRTHQTTLNQQWYRKPEASGQICRKEQDK
jgi:hypothetical protein